MENKKKGAFNMIISKDRLDDFDNSFTQLILNEGGYSNDALDSGGKTIYGITQRDYPKEFSRIYNFYINDQKLRALNEAKLFYKENFWNPLYMEIPDSSLSFKIFDLSVNRGKITAIKILQRAIYFDFGKTIKVDGKFGQITLGAIKSIESELLYKSYIKWNENSYRSLSMFWYFGKGWLNRLFKRKFV